jgi:ElaB/YqjD/DUF883 family membrane-anchored ribosome-binding protein
MICNMDTYVIDEAVARSDMAKMNQAVSHLQQARQTVVRLMNEAETMQGQTGAAIVEKAQELQVRIDRLTRQLQNSVQLLGSTVAHYQHIDDAHAEKIRR